MADGTLHAPVATAPALQGTHIRVATHLLQLCNERICPAAVRKLAEAVAPARGAAAATAGLLVSHQAEASQRGAGGQEGVHLHAREVG